MSAMIRSMFPNDILEDIKRENCVPKELEELLFWSERTVPEWVVTVRQRIQAMFPLPKWEIEDDATPESLSRKEGFYAGCLMASEFHPTEEHKLFRDEEQIESLKQRIGSAKFFSFQHAIAWFDGFARGLHVKLLDDQGRPARHTTALPIYSALLENWWEVSALGSTTELYHWLTARIPSMRGKTPELELADQQMVQQLCRRIGLHFKKRGRPRSKK